MGRRWRWVADAAIFFCLCVGGAALQEGLRWPLFMTYLFFLPAFGFVWIRLRMTRLQAMAFLVLLAVLTVLSYLLELVFGASDMPDYVIWVIGPVAGLGGSLAGRVGGRRGRGTTPERFPIS